MVKIGSGAEKEIDDILLTRYACYLIAQNGDSHVDNNLGVRKIMIERGIIPENLPPAEDVQKVERRLKSEEKNIIDNE
jgi:DNA-damage-inducible protein D